MLIKLKGELGDKFGEEHDFAIHRPSDALRLLSINFPDFEDYFSPRWYQVLRHNPKTGKSDALTIHEIGLGNSKHEIHIVPQVQGAKDGEDKTILGIVMIATAIVWSGGFAAFGSAAKAAALGGNVSGPVFLALAGVGVTGYGISKLLSAPRREIESSVFDSGINSIEQGVAIPLVYGQYRTGSIVASTSLTIDQIKRYSQWRPFNTVTESESDFSGVDTYGPDGLIQEDEDDEQEN